MTRGRTLSCAAAAAALLAALATGGCSRPDYAAIAVGLPRLPANAAWFVALETRLFEEQGIHVIDEPYEVGAQALAGLANGRVDLAIAADTPIVFEILSGARLSIVATTFRSRRSLAIVARRDRGIAAARDLAGRAVGYTPRINAHFFVDSFLAAHAVEARLTPLAPAELLSSLQAGAVDAIVAWDPIRSQALSDLGARATELTAPDLDTFRFNLVGKADFVTSHTRELAAMLRALKRAGDLMARDPAYAAEVTQRYAGKPDAAGLRVEEYTTILEPELLAAMRRQAEWAVRKGLTQARELPDFRAYVAADALREAAPGQVLLDAQPR